MSQSITLEQLWGAIPGDNLQRQQQFDPGRTSGLPEPARRYLTHAIAAGTRLASAVRLTMHGEIKLAGWSRFTAEQVINWSRGMMWQATVRVHGIPISGGDSFADGEGAMRWKALGIVPIVSASGVDITRSTAGRVNVESI